MKIERLEVGGFGRLAGFDSGEHPLPRLVVVLGPNEAGKSTLFEFLTTLLHGFLPASRELNPFVPWGSDEAGGTLHLRLADGRQAEITRRLRSQPAGRMTLDGVAADLRNQPVPLVEHVPRTVFRQLFAVTLGELAHLDDDTWARIQDRVVGSMGASDLRPVRAVATELERQAGELWRPNRRGNQKIRAAREELRTLRGRRREALDADRRLRQSVDEIERDRAVLAAKRDRRARDQAELERARVLAPLRAQLHRIDTLRMEAGPPELLSGLPADPVAHHAELVSQRDRLRHALDELDHERGAPERELAAFGEEAVRVLDARDEIARFSATAARAAADRQRAAELEEECRTLEHEIDGLARDLTGGPWEPDSPIGDAPIGPLENAIDLLGRVTAEAHTPDALRPGDLPGRVPEVRPAPDRTPGMVLLVVGGLLLVVGGVGGGSLGPTWVAVGTGLVVAGGWLLWTAARSWRERTAANAELEKERAAAEAEVARRRADAEARVDRARAEYEQAAAALGLADRYRTAPDRRVIDRIERLREHIGNLGRRRHATREVRTRIEAASREGRALVHRLIGTDAPVGLPAPATEGDQVAAWAGLLAERVRHAESAERAARAAERELARIARNREDVQARLSHALEHLRALDARAEGFEGVTVAERLAAAARRLDAHERATQLAEELERGHPDLPLLRRRIEEAEQSGARWLHDERDLVERRERVERLSGEIEGLTARIQALESGVEHARGQDTADRIDGEIAALEARVEAWTLERDRKWVLQKLIREADRRFREEHQPDLMRRASAYLARLTEGRYDRILVEEDEDSDLFRISGPGLAGPIALRHPISTGTLEQAYLSLRLAIVDHLDPGPDRLPLFIDEVFVNWDDARRTRGLEVVADIARDRQVFVFTCHPSMADALRGLGAGLVTLPPR